MRHGALFENIGTKFEVLRQPSINTNKEVSIESCAFDEPCAALQMKVVVTGIGIVSPLGVGTRVAWQNLLEHKCGIVHLGQQYADIPSQVGGRVPEGTGPGQWNSAQWIDTANLRRTPLFAQYAICAAKQALEDAQWNPTSEPDLQASGVAIGSGIGGFDAAYSNAIAYHTGGYRKVSPMFVPNLLANMAAGHVSIATGFRGPNHAASTACTTGLHAIGDAVNMIRCNMAKVMLAGSTEACIHPLAVAGFARARSLATKYNEKPHEASRPFDAKRDGFVIGEGAAVLVLESAEHAAARGAKVYAEVAGYGMSGDAFHITAPSSDGRGAFDCMRMALAQAGVDGKMINYVNAHATSTPLGDAIETSAIVRALNRPPSEINVSSTKGATGHLLGAAGSLEAAFTVLSVYENKLPPSLNISELEPGFECNYIRQTTVAEVNYALSNSFGFGGTNGSIIFKAVD